ncbi:exosome complex protein Rrp42 [Candidatus Woesearchaeota archaeon]|nr:exosome complex protein Rrp42 [Candidatus Woesearchaeota archaeon]
MSDGQKDHMIKSLSKGIRQDGRKLEDFREVSVEYGASKSAEGSARVKIGDTEVIAGVKMEMGEPFPDTPDKGALMVGAEFLPMASPEFELGPPGIDAIEIARVADRGIRESGAIDLSKLCIKEGEKCWMVVIDVCTINDAGNLQDTTALAALAAIKDTKLPKLEDDGKVNYKEKTDQGLPINCLPIAVTVVKIGDSFMVDPIIKESEFLDARLTVTTLDDGTICAMQKGGVSPLTVDDIDKMVGIAAEKASMLRKSLG